MSDDTSTRGTEEFLVLRGPDGALYMLSDTNLERHRVPEEVAPALLEAYESQSEVSGFISHDAGSFQILGTGPLVRERFGANPLPPIDTWVDTM